MRAIFYAIAPETRRNTRVLGFENLNIDPLMAKIVGLDTTPTDRDPKVVAPSLRKVVKKIKSWK
jgi:hypothetical protein